jgi:hypothetical protein
MQIKLTSTQSAFSDTTPPSAIQTNDGVLEITPSQLVAVVVGTIIGTAIFTLILIYMISICRNRRQERAYLKYEGKKSNIALNSVTNISSRGEFNLSREEKQRINWPSDTHPSRTLPPRTILGDLDGRLCRLCLKSQRVDPRAGAYPPSLAAIRPTSLLVPLVSGPALPAFQTWRQ